jgi:Tfp pilus assembly protein PilF
VSRAEILDAVWPDVNVTDDSITQCVGELRRALGDEAGLLKTIPRRGYLLELAPEAAAVVPPALVPEPVAASAKPLEVTPPAPVAVVRFAGRSRGVAAGVLLLAAVFGAWFLVPARQPAVREAASSVTPPAVANGAAPASDPQAPSAAEQSMALWREGRATLRSSGRIVETRLQARALFERAIELDPTNFRAMAEAAFTYTNAVLGGASLNPEADLARAAALTERAVAIESRHAVTHTARAAVLRIQRRHEEALEHYRMAVLLDPSAHASRANVGWMLLLIGRSDEAAAPVLASLAADPNPQFLGAWLAYLGLIQLHGGSGDHGVARLRESLEHEAAFMSRHERLVYLVAALAANADTEAARNLAADVSDRYPQVTLAWFSGRAQSDHPIYRTQFERIIGLLRTAGIRE